MLAVNPAIATFRFSSREHFFVNGALHWRDLDVAKSDPETFVFDSYDNCLSCSVVGGFSITILHC